MLPGHAALFVSRLHAVGQPFRISRHAAHPVAEGFQSTATVPASPHITREGQVIGTLTYMSPEQVQGKPVDARTDVFSFGVVLYEMLAGQRPFAGDSFLDTAARILRDDPLPLANLRQDLPPEIQDILTGSIAKDPADRYDSCQEVHQALLAFQQKSAARQAGVVSLLRRPAVLATMGLVLVLMVAGSTWLLQRNSRISWARNEALTASFCSKTIAAS